MRPAFDRHVPPGWPSKVLLPLGRPLVDLEARWFYPERTPGKWVTMVGATAKDARAQVAAMDRHVEALLARLDQSATWPIVWYRGPLLGLRAVRHLRHGDRVRSRPVPARSRRPDERGPPRGRPLRHHPELHCPERPAEGPDGRVGSGQPGHARRGTGQHRLERPREGAELDPPATGRPGLVLVFGAGGLQAGRPARQLPPPGVRSRGDS